MKFALFYFLSIFWFGCATSKSFNKLSIGMSKDEAVSILGTPVSVSAPGPGQEYLNYRFAETDAEAQEGISKPYFVLIENDSVIQYGRYGDFGYSNEHTINVNTVLDKNTSGYTETPTERMQKELNALKELLDEGILTKEEFDRKKKEVLNK